MDEKTNTNKEKKRKERSLNECCPAYLSLFWILLFASVYLLTSVLFVPWESPRSLQTQPAGSGLHFSFGALRPPPPALAADSEPWAQMLDGSCLSAEEKQGNINRPHFLREQSVHPSWGGSIYLQNLSLTGFHSGDQFSKGTDCSVFLCLSFGLKQKMNSRTAWRLLKCGINHASTRTSADISKKKPLPFVIGKHQMLFYPCEIITEHFKLQAYNYCVIIVILQLVPT